MRGPCSHVLMEYVSMHAHDVGSMYVYWRLRNGVHTSYGIGKSESQAFSTSMGVPYSTHMYPIKNCKALTRLAYEGSVSYYTQVATSYTRIEV